MKTLKTIALVTIFIATFNVANAQDTNAQTVTEAVIGVMKTYKDAIQNLLKVSNTNFGTTSLFLTTILFLSFTYFTLPEQQLGAPNTYLYSDLITDIKSNNVSYVEISIDSDVSNIKISKDMAAGAVLTAGLFLIIVLTTLGYDRLM